MARGMVVALALHLWFPKWGAGSPKGTWSYCVVGAIRQINFNFLFCNFISFATDSTAGVNVFSTCGPVSEWQNVQGENQIESSCPHDHGKE